MCVAEPTAASVAAPAQSDMGPKNFAVGVGLGYAFGGTANVGGNDVDHDGGLLGDLYVDAILVPAFSMGAYLTRTSMTPEGSDTSFNCTSVGAVLKARLRLSERIRLRPGLTIGYNSITRDGWDSSSGMNAGMHLDLAIATSDHIALVPRFGFFSQPVGGNKDVDISFVPHPYLAFAVEFGS